MDWSYVAFGHFHKPGWIPGYKGKAAYSGSLENTVISGPDVCHHRGPVFVDLEKNGTEIYDMHEKPIRRIMSLPEIDITGQDISADELDKRITNLITTSDIENAIVIHKVKGITKSLYKTIPHRTFNHVSQAALYLRTDFEFASDAFVLDAVKPEDTDEETDNIDGTEETSVQENETQEVDPTQTFLPLDKEMELAVKQLVKTGRISANKEEKIKNVLLGLITSE